MRIFESGQPDIHKILNIRKISKYLPLVLLLLGGALRLAFLGTMPGGMHQDESFVAWNAYALLHEGRDSAGHVMPVYLADWGDGHSALYVWLLMPLLALNGGHVTTFLSRLPQALVSITTLWVVYCLMKRMFGKTAGLWSLFLLAICPWHIMMSRWGLDANLAPGFLMFGFYFFIRGTEQKKFLLLSALFYGLSLYSYAVIWTIVPVMLLLQIIYCLAHKKLRIDRWSLLSTLLLFVMAVPLLLFVLVNSDIIGEISLPFMTIPKMGGYRGSEIAFTLSGMYANLRTALSLLYHQNTGSPFDILLPWGLFYDIGRLFIILGVCSLLWRVVKSLRRKEFAWEVLLLIQLLGGGLVCLTVSAVLHQINALYIPLVLCEAYGVLTILNFFKTKQASLQKLFGTVTVAVYLLCLILFQRDYYTDYRTLVNAYFAKGLEDCVDFALEQCNETGLSVITAEKGAQWPRLLLFTETLPSQYLASVEYDVAPAPAAFTSGNIRINTRINYDNINKNSIYILYYTDIPVFEQDFTLTRFEDWYVAVPD